MRQSGLLLATGLAVAFLCTGCPFSDVHLQLDLTPGSNKCEAAGSRVHVPRVKDGRVERFRIGVKKNGYGSETASVFLKQDQGSVPEWVHRTMVRELVAAGLEVSDEPAPTDERVTLTVKQFFVEPRIDVWYMELHGVLLLNLEVRLTDGRRYSRLIRGYWSDTVLLLLESNYEKALNRAARQAFANAAGAICSLLAAEAGK